MKKRLLFVGIVMVFMLALGSAAQADTITLVFNYEIENSSPFNLTPGSFGTLKFTDSLVDPNRVDVEWHLTPAFGATLERVLLNFTGTPFPSGANDPFLVAQNAAAGSQANIGTILDGSNVQTLGPWAFDIRVSPTDNDFDFFGSIAVFNTSLNPDVELNIDLANFYPVTSGGTGTPALYAAYRTNNNPNPPPSGEFWAGSTTTGVVPEPATMLLLGSGLIGLAGFARKRFRNKS